MISGLEQVKSNYQDRYFTITDFRGDNKFEHIQDFLSPAHLHICSANEHTNDIEQSIWKIKERVRCILHYTAVYPVAFILLG